MKEQNNPRLTLFARLWPVSVVLFIVFSILYAYACMNNYFNLKGLGLVGSFIMLFVQVCQLIAANKMRRWWCFTGIIIGIVLSIVVFISCCVAAVAGQYHPSVNKEGCEEVCDTTETETEAVEEIDYSFPVNFQGKEPTIVDFITALSAQPDMGEALGWMSKNWELYQQGKPLLDEITFDVDLKKSYFRYTIVIPQEAGWVSSGIIEFLCWDFKDQKHKLIVHNTVDYCDGEPVDGQFSGLSYYIYDIETRRMDFVSPPKLNAYLDTMPDGTCLIVSKLPRKGYTIECKCYTPTREVTKHLTWNGMRFDHD